MKRKVICYCYHVSHTLNLGSIPKLLADLGWKVQWFNAFPREYFPIQTDPRIEYFFNIDLKKIGEQNSDLYLSPFVGQSDYFPKGALRTHFLVSLTSIEAVYDKSMFDYYDVIACAGKHHIDEFQELGEIRNWKQKILLPLGYPKLDIQRKILKENKNQSTKDRLTIIFAPTHAYYINQQFSVLRNYGKEIIKTLIEQNFNVIFRPHMESWKDQDRFVTAEIASIFRDNPQFTLDRSGNYFESYSRSDAMITDISGTGFTYSFTFERPAIFFAPTKEEEIGKQGIQFQRRENIGLVVRKIDELGPKLHALREHSDFIRQQIIDYRNYLIFNLDRSESYFANHAWMLTDKHQADNWVYL